MTFLLNLAFVAVLCLGAQLLLQSYPDSDRLGTAVKFGMIVPGAFWVWSVLRRLRDAGLPRWLLFPYGVAVFGACAAVHLRRILDWQETLAFFFILQIPTVLFPSKPRPASSSRRSGTQTSVPTQPYPEYNRPVGRFQFVLRVVFIGALFTALLQLAREAGPGVAAWEMRAGIVLFAFVWILSVEGRVMDAGLPQWFSIPYCLLLPAVSALPHFLKIFNLDVALLLFVILQVPTIFFNSRPPRGGPSAQDANMQEATVSTALHGSQAARPDPSLDGVEFAVYTVLIAGLWYVMHLLRGDAGLGPRSWVPDLGLDTGALLLCVLWTICVAWRLRNVGLPSLAVDFCLFILATSLLPLALGVISFPVSLLIFAVLQIPAVFMRRKTMPTGDLSVQADS
jgi:uncharacterized membrane protein YhaH (DUF805 family)